MSLETKRFSRIRRSAVAVVVLALPAVLSAAGEAGEVGSPQLGSPERAAQLRVLRLRHRGTVPQDSVERLLRRYREQDMPGWLFEPEALRRAALEETAERLRRFPPASRPTIVVQAEVLYGLSRQQLDDHLPVPTGDRRAQVEAVLASSEPRQRVERSAQLLADPWRAAEVKTLLGWVEESGSPELLDVALEVLRTDVSLPGRGFLYRRLAAATEAGDAASQARLLEVLRSRRGFVASELTAYLATAPASEPLAIVFDLAAAGLHLGVPDAAELLLGELANTAPEHRRLAAEALAEGRRPEHVEPLLSALESEPEPPVRAAVAKALGLAAHRDEVRAALLERVASEPSAAVRAAAVAALPLAARPGEGEAAERDRELIARLRSAVGGDAALVEQLEGKVAVYEAARQALAADRMSRGLRAAHAYLESVAAGTAEPLAAADLEQLDERLAAAGELLAQAGGEHTSLEQLHRNTAALLAEQQARLAGDR